MSTISSSTTSTTAYKVTADTTGTLVLQTGATPTTAVTIDTSQNTTLAGYLNAPNTFGFKNRIINGAMVIDQRNAGASGTATGYNIDRWVFGATLTTKGTWQQNAGSVTPPTGFKNYLGFTSNSAYTPSTSDVFSFYQVIEGFNCADLMWGTANAQTVTVSFWVRSSLTGTFGGALSNTTRSNPFSYTISSANTWEQKTVTVAGDTSGTWNSTNGQGIFLFLTFGAGSTYQGTAGTWATADYRTVTGAVNTVGTNAATLYITGVQLEKGSTATSFDYRPYGTEFALCQRYYRTSFPYGTAPAQNAGQQGAIAIQSVSTSANTISVYIQVNPPMRTNPTTVTYYNTNSANALWRNTSSNADGSATGQINGSSTGWTVFMNGSPSAIGNTYQIQYSADAEL